MNDIDIINNEDLKHNIKNFLNTKESLIYHNKVQNILKLIQSITDCDILVFGGYLRTILENYHDNKFKKPNDIDIWLIKKKGLSFSYNYFYKFINNIFNTEFKKNKEYYKKKYNISDIFIEKYPRSTLGFYDGPIEYGSFKIKIDGILFDITTSINSSNYLTSFKKICDYSINNLYYDSSGTIYTRCESIYNVNNIIEHIKDKILYNIYNYNFLKKYYDEPNESYTYYKTKFPEICKYRLEKLKSNNYCLNN